MNGDWQNKLYFGDNLDILREYVAPESVDLIIKASSNEGDLVLDAFCVPAGTKVVTPLCPPASGGKGIPAGPSVDRGKGQGGVRSLPACGEGRVGSRASRY